jgi:hypothetical protein
MARRHSTSGGIRTMSTAAQPGPTAPRELVIARRMGRLANRLVLFASFAAFAEEHGYGLTNVTFHSYEGWFEATRRNISCRYPPPRRRSMVDLIPGLNPLLRRTRVLTHLARGASAVVERCGWFRPWAVTWRDTAQAGITWLDDDAATAFLRPARVVFVNGWTFRAPRLLRKHAAKIREFFRPVAEVRAHVERTLRPLRERADVIVGVHVRRGDYRTWQGGRYFYPPAAYAAWMREFAAAWPGRRVGFFVSSDEPLPAAEFAPLDVQFAGGPTAVHDLHALAACDYLFGPPSTFSQWASFAGDTPVQHLEAADEHVDLARFHVSHFERIW